MPFPLNDTHVEGELGHIDDHNEIAALMNTMNTDLTAVADYTLDLRSDLDAVTGGVSYRRLFLLGG